MEESGVRESRALLWMIKLSMIIIGVSVVAGISAALFGGRLTGLGAGAGGLYGFPSLLLTLAALFVGLPAAVIIAGRIRPGDGWIGAAVVVAGGAWVVAIGYFVVAHLVDPCVNGWWDLDSRIGSQPLCERFGFELNWHTRFHLLAHAAPSAGLLALYVWAIRRLPGRLYTRHPGQARRRSHVEGR